MSKLQLPTSGAVNWGSGLNAYIRHLETRIQTLEKNYGDQTISDVVQNVAGACTGVISNFECLYNNSDNSISFSGLVYYAGDIRKIIEVQSSQKIIGSTNLYNDSKKSYFIYLKYDPTIAGDEIDKLAIDFQPELKLSYNKILIGFYFNRQFVPYFYWDMKTILQHHYELTHLYNDLNENALVIDITSNKVSSVDIGPANCNVYCGGIGYSSVDSPDIYTVEDNQPYNLSIKDPATSPIQFFVDQVDENELISTNAPTTTAPNANTDNLYNGNYYRILLDIFGNTYVQKAAKNGYMKLKDYGSEQALLNVRFGREFFDKNEDHYTYSLQANLFMEVGRFAYNGDDVNSLDTTYTNNIGEGLVYPSDILYTHSVRDGVAGQPFLGVWDIKQGHLFLDSLKFNQTAESSSYDFSIKYKDTLTLNDINFGGDGKTATNFLSEDPSLYGLEKVVLEEKDSKTIFKSLLFKNSVEKFTFSFGGNSHEISLTSGCLYCETPFSEQTFNSCAYKGKGYTLNVELTDSDNFIEVKFDIVNGDLEADKNSDITKISELTIISIQAKDELSLILDPTTSTSLSPQFLWTQTSSSEAIQLITENSQLVIPSSSNQPALFGGKGLLLKDNDRNIINSSLIGGTVINLYEPGDATSKKSKVEHKMIDTRDVDRISEYQINQYYQQDSSSDFSIPHTFISTKCILKDVGSAGVASKEMNFNADKINIDGTIYMQESDQILFVSDARRKENFEPVNQSYLEVVQNVPVFKYNYKNSSRNQIGIIAQDLEKALNSYQECFINIQDTSEMLNQRSLNENKLVFILWKALQEETQMRHKLEQRLEKLERNL